jgi:hypothetical protein
MSPREKALALGDRKLAADLAMGNLAALLGVVDVLLGEFPPGLPPQVRATIDQIGAVKDAAEKLATEVAEYIHGT